ncbi:hypothetical protein [Streptomyces sp. AK02-01A]|uniref:hypothetical protein n=1 Tax=Streptomyces sp. AK02-01A TaxID=3028648 RepID=UPI0029BC3EF3|nr:hypothetical protein [Streptomyces sp. AK02-01A]MDX3853178.1 hypothetical protein [Streptomyces sp. AK02-01A]
MNASEEAARGLTDIEEFLYWEAHLEAAHRRVADFTARAPGLTQEQKIDIERWYLEEQRYVARMVTEHIADTISVVEDDHHIRFGRWLRGTLTAMVLITAAMIGLCVAVIMGTSS